MKVTWMDSERVRPVAGTYRAVDAQHGYSHRKTHRRARVHAHSPPVIQSVHSGSICMTALNLSDVGLKLDLMQHSLETLSSSLVNYLIKKSFGLHNVTEINEEYEERIAAQHKCLLTCCEARSSRSQHEESVMGVFCECVISRRCKSLLENRGNYKLVYYFLLNFKGYFRHHPALKEVEQIELMAAFYFFISCIQKLH